MAPDMPRRMKQYLFLRLLIVVVGFLLATFYVANVEPESQEATTTYLFSILTVYACVGVTSLVTFSGWSELRSMHRLQVLADFGLQGLLVWSSGGVVSFFIPLVFVTLVSATALWNMRGALSLATVATLFLIGTTVLYACDITPPWGTHGRRIDAVTTAYLVVSVLALYGLSVLGSRYSFGLREVESLQKEVIDGMTEGLLLVDRDARVRLINEEFLRLLGLPGGVQSYEGEPVVDVLRASRVLTPGSPAHETFLDALFRGGSSRVEIHPDVAGSARRPLEVKASTLLDATSAPRYRLALVGDLTMRRELEAQDRRIAKLEDLRELAMGLVHEIRNPLASIRGCTQELARSGDDPRRLARLSEIVLRESDRLDAIIENFCGFARPKPVERAAVDLGSVIAETVVLLESRTDFARRTLSTTSFGGDASVLADRGQLVQVLLNLGINAIHATDPGSGKVGIEVYRVEEPTVGFAPRPSNGDGASGNLAAESACSSAAAWVEVHVWDNGKGIRVADQGRVFQPFFTTKEGGSGLGLSIVETIIREHHGTIDVESREGIGTRFVVRLAALASVDVDATDARRPACQV